MTPRLALPYPCFDIIKCLSLPPRFSIKSSLMFSHSFTLVTGQAH